MRDHTSGLCVHTLHHLCCECTIPILRVAAAWNDGTTDNIKSRGPSRVVLRHIAICAECLIEVQELVERKPSPC